MRTFIMAGSMFICDAIFQSKGIDNYWSDGLTSILVIFLLIAVLMDIIDFIRGK